MNKMKKFASMAAAILMTACVAIPTTMSLTASAVQEVTLAVDPTTGLPISGTNELSNITAYQIFKGNYIPATTDPSTSTIITAANLSVTGWGDGINAKTFVAALKNDTTFGASFDSVTYSESNPEDSAKAVAAIMGTWINDSAEAQAFAKLAVLNKNSNNGTAGAVLGSERTRVTFEDDLSDGYYVVTCTVSNYNGTTTESGSNEYSAHSLGMLAVLGGGSSELKIGTNGIAKVSLPEVMKKVYENVKTSENPATIGGYRESSTYWNDVADYCIGDSVPFKLYGTMPQDIANYEHYYYQFTDTLGKEFTAPESVTIKVNNTPISKPVNSDIFTSIKTDTDGVTTITVTFEDVKEVIKNATEKDVSPTDVVTIEYNAVLNSNAVIGLPGQENKVDLTYSNNPNVSYKPNGGSGDETPGTPDENESDTPDTPNDKGKTPEDKVIVFTYEADFKKVDAESQEPLANVEFKLKNADGNYVTLDNAGKVTGWNTTGTTIKSGTDGTFKIIGLDDGVYTLEETKPLKDYNPIADTTLIISAGTENNQAWDGNATSALTSFKYKIGDSNTESEGTPADGIASGTIKNKKGSSLPSTGGIGTTLFYVCGGAMVAVSGVFLITKKRMNKNKD